MDPGSTPGTSTNLSTTSNSITTLGTVVMLPKSYRLTADSVSNCTFNFIPNKLCHTSFQPQINTGKVKWLVENLNGIVLDSNVKSIKEAIEAGLIPIVVVPNGFFEMAFIAYDEAELYNLNKLHDHDSTVVLIKRTDVERLCPECVGNLNW